ncbi:hypothetical protein ACFX13_011272 [Malus domestica]
MRCYYPTPPPPWSRSADFYQDPERVSQAPGCVGVPLGVDFKDSSVRGRESWPPTVQDSQGALDNTSHKTEYN